MSNYSKKRKPFLLFLIFGMVASIAAVGSSYFTKRYLQTERAEIGSSGTPLKGRSSMAMEDMLSDNAKDFDWIQKKDYIVRVEAFVNGKEYVQDDGLLKLSEDGESFTAVGIGTGKIVFQKTSFSDVVVEVPFSINFDSQATSSYLSDSGYILDEDGIITESEFATVKTIKIKNSSSVDFSDFELMPKLERVEIEEGALLDVISPKNIAQGANIYVQDEAYLDYMQSPSWKEVAERIFIQPKVEGNVSLILYRGGGKFLNEEDNAKEYLNLEVKKGSTFEDLETRHRIRYEGHTFRGWFYDDETANFHDKMVFDRDIKLYAIYEAQRYTVRFHYRDGENEKVEEVKNFLYDDSVSLPSTEELPYGDRYIFRGWSVNENSREIDYGPSEKVYHLFKTDTFIYDLYGVWAQPEFTVHYMNGDDEICSFNYRYGENVSVILPTNKIAGNGRLLGFDRDRNGTSAEYELGQEGINIFARADESSDIYLYAIFNPNDYFTIDYLDKDGEPLFFDPEHHYDYNQVRLISWDEDEVEAGLSKEGHRFLGWKDDATNLIYIASHKEYERLALMGVEGIVDCEEDDGFITDNFHDVNSVTLEPYFVKNSFNVIFDDTGLTSENGDSMYENGVANFGEDFRLTGSISRTGYSFEGFSTKDNEIEINPENGFIGSSSINSLYESLLNEKAAGVDNNFDPDSSITLYSSWLGNPCTITFDLDGKAATPIAPQQLRVGDKVEEPDEPIGDPWRFDGWYTDNGKWDFDWTVKGDMTLKAHWSLDHEYVVEYKMNNSGASVTANVTYYEPGDLVNGGVAPSVSHVPGYEFLGWFADESLTVPFDFENTRITDVKTYVYAKWEALSYTVNFHNNGHGETYPSQENLSYNSMIQDPGPMYEYGWKFLGWYRDESFSQSKPWDFARDRINESVFGGAPDTTIDLYAKWEAMYFTVTFSSSVDPKYKEERIVRQGETINNVPSVPNVTGYNSGQWVVKKGDGSTEAFNAGAPVESDLTVEARYSINTYTIKFITPVGPVPNNQRVEHGNKISDPGVSSTTSWDFCGWFTDENFEQEWSIDKDKPNQSMTLYAKWECTVSFDPNDDNQPKSHDIKDMPSSIKVVYGDTISKPNNPSGTGLNFKGWSTSKTTYSEFNFSAPYVGGHTTLYASWEKRLYTINFDLDGGSGDSTPQQRYYGQKGNLPTPSKKDHTFGHWERKDNKAVFDGNSEMPASDIYLKATYSKDSCVDPNTLITMADYSVKAIKDLEFGDMVLGFDHYTGQRCGVPVILIENLYDVEQFIMDMTFSDGTSLRFIYRHGLFDATLNRYVTVDEESYPSLIGHQFFKDDGSHVTLVSVVTSYEVTDTCAILTAKTMNHYYNGILGSVPEADQVMNVFEFDENHVVDAAKMEELIAIYGIMEYEDFNGLIDREAYELLDNVKYFSIILGTGALTEEDMVHLFGQFQSQEKDYGL